MMSEFQCPRVGCGQVYNNRMSLHRHKLKCTYTEPDISTLSKYVVQDDGTLKCTTCSKKYADKPCFSRHRKQCQKDAKAGNIVRKDRSDTKEYICQTCSKSFPTQSKLKRHTQTHTNKKTLICEHCSQVYMRKDHYESHLKRCKNREPDSDDIPNSATNEKSALPSNHSMVHASYLEVPTEQYNVPDQELLMNVQLNDEYFQVNDNTEYPDLESVLLELDSMLSDATDVAVPPDVTLPCDATLSPDVTLPPEIHVTPNQLSEEQFQTPVESSPKTSMATRYRRAKELHGVIDQSFKAMTPRRMSLLTGSPANALVEMLGSSSSIETINDARTGVVFLKYLKSIYMANITTNASFAREIVKVFGPEIFEDKGLLNHILSKSVPEKRIKHICRIKASLKVIYDNNFEMKRKQLITNEVKNLIYQKWLDPANSIVTADRRNNRDQVLIKRDIFHTRYPSITDTNLKEVTSKRNVLSYSAVRHISTTTVRAMQKKLKDEDDVKVSIGTIVQLKPYYIGQPSLREQILCMCAFCLNTRQLYDTIRKAHTEVKVDIGNSISEFLTKGVVCPKGENGYTDLACINETCGSKDCKISIDLSPLVNMEKKWKYYAFEVIKIPYVNKKGENKISKQCTRVDKEATLEAIIGEVNKIASKYLYHRYLVVNDGFIWPKILSTATAEAPIFHLDYSENLQCTPKYEPQAHHFSGTQVVLHCSVIHQSLSNNAYVYHFTDDKKKDQNTTLYIVKDLVTTFVDTSKPGSIIRLKSDNCQEQYKCRSVFGQYVKLAKELGCPVLVYYGVAGHGKGLVDAMSGFGVKTPLRKLIQTEDFYYKTAEDVCCKLSSMFEEDKSKLYIQVPIETLNEKRKLYSCVDDIKLPDTRKLHVILYKPTGEMITRFHLCECSFCLAGNIDQCIKCTEDTLNVHLAENPTECSDDEDNDEIYDDLRKNLVSVGSYVAVRSDEKATLPYWLYEVVSLGDDSFLGIFIEPIKGDRLKLRKTNVKEEVSFFCVFSADVQLTEPESGKGKGKKNVFSLKPEIDVELCHYS